ATVLDTNISTLSSELVISTGIPDQKSMSISVSNFRPSAWLTDNVPVSITVNLADANNNPAPAGTAVSFTTEGGVIDSKCTTGLDAESNRPNGRCSVSWRSTEPRPGRSDNTSSIDRLLCRNLSDI